MRLCRPGPPALAAALLLTATACRLGVPPPATEQASEIADLYRVFLIAGVVVGGIVYALIIYSAIRFRRRTDELPKQTRAHIPLEVGYTAIPVGIVLVLFLLTFQTERRVDALADDPAVEVNVVGFQWQWRFEYPDHGISIVGAPGRPPTMVVPARETVRITLSGRDVIHAFYVPEFLFKRDVIPGVRNVFDLVIPRRGTFRGECAEYCGLHHNAMGFFVRAVSPTEFERWLDARSGAAR